ncbi:hypothetical protein T440DRAFT_407504, partial [Plenodomus tracheiphilus IPT5]
NVATRLNARDATCVRRQCERNDFPQAKISICRTSVGVLTRWRRTKSSPRVIASNLNASQTPQPVSQAVILAFRSA